MIWIVVLQMKSLNMLVIIIFFYYMKDVDTSVQKNLLFGLAATAPLCHKWPVAIVLFCKQKVLGFPAHYLFWWSYKLVPSIALFCMAGNILHHFFWMVPHITADHFVHCLPYFPPPNVSPKIKSSFMGPDLCIICPKYSNLLIPVSVTNNSCCEYSIKTLDNGQ